jgi:hypothetical protein
MQKIPCFTVAYIHDKPMSLEPWSGDFFVCQFDIPEKSLILMLVALFADIQEGGGHFRADGV